MLCGRQTDAISTSVLIKQWHNHDLSKYSNLEKHVKVQPRELNSKKLLTPYA
jgi:hypothetical protein